MLVHKSECLHQELLWQFSIRPRFEDWMGLSASVLLHKIDWDRSRFLNFLQNVKCKEDKH